MDKHSADEDHQPIQSAGEHGKGTPGDKDPVISELAIVRTSTPRPLPVSALPTWAGPASTEPAPGFPWQAPIAPPLPEEAGAQEATRPLEHPKETVALPTMEIDTAQQAGASEFAWLFEYGMEMEPAYLNSPEHLNRQAHRYGPAVLRGYQLRGIELPNGQIVPTLVKSRSTTQEVWGMLYRIPQRLLEHARQAPSPLDLVHAIPIFTTATITVEESYRKRNVQCITYRASEHIDKEHVITPAEQRRLDRKYAQQLLPSAKRLALPVTYLEELTAIATASTQGQSTSQSSNSHDIPGTANSAGTADTAGSIGSHIQFDQHDLQRVEQHTEPLPAFSRTPQAPHAPQVISGGDAPNPTYPTYPTRTGGMLIALAFYLVLLLLAELALAVIQALGYWPEVFNASFAPLGVPWSMLLYGLIGGTMSCIIAVGSPGSQHRSSVASWPGYVYVTWLVRPFLGAILAALAYFVLTSGLFALSASPAQRFATYATLGAIAGFSEGWMFFRQK